MHTTITCAWCSRIQFDDGPFVRPRSPSHGPERRLQLDREKYSRGTWLHPVDLAIYDSFPDLANLTDASRSGCLFAAFLHDVLKSADVQYQLNDDIRNFEGRYLPFKLVFAYAWGELESGAGNSGLEALRITVHLDTVEGSPRDNEPPFTLSVVSIGLHSECYKWLGIDRPYPISKPWDSSAVDWTAYQLTACDEKRDSHSNYCGSDYTRGYLPTRLIDLRHNILEVVHGADILASMSDGEPVPHYAALSYCWGSPADAELQLKLFTPSLVDRRFAFTLTELPAVTRDAVTVARSLSLQYLWVDALCILQDDQSDWETESSHMGQIYGSAYITICSLTPSCHLSFLDPEISTTTIEFQSSRDQNIHGQYGIIYDYCVSLRSGAGLVVDRLMENRWVRRGWTFQEAFLSARLLSFEQSDVSFACSDRIAYRSGYTGPRPFESLRMLQDDLEDPRESVWALWYQCVLFGYCERAFTQPHDVFPAISGVAEIFNKTFKANYVAGLWDTDLPISLMWEVDAESHRWSDLTGLLNSQQPTSLGELITTLTSGPFVSPSWSWAGRQTWVNSPIVGYSHLWSDVRDECRIRATTLAKGNNPFGRLEDAWIEFSGSTITIGPCTPMLPSGSFPGHYKIELPGGGWVTLRFDWYIDDINLEGDFKMILLGSFLESPGGEDEGVDASLPILDEEKGERTAFGLVVHRAPRGNAFVRVGVFFSLVTKGGGMKYLTGYGEEDMKLI